MITKNLLMGSALLALCGTAFLTPAQAANTIILKNGDRLSGMLSSSDQSGMIRLESVYGTAIDLPLEQIVAMQDERGTSLSLPGLPIAAATPEAPAPETVEPAAGKDSAAYEWSGRANIGAFIDDGNSQKKAVSGDAEMTARNEKNRWIAGGDLHFANDNGTETENDQSLYGEYNRFVTDKWFYGVRQDFKIDKIADLDLRSKTGPFVGYQFFEEDDLNLKVRFGSDYVYEDFSSGDTEENVALAWGLNYDQTFADGSFTLFHNHEIDTPFDEVDAFLFQSDSGVRVPVGKYLTGTGQIDFDWDNAPAPGIEKRDTKYILKLGYEW
ncbi:MAG: DUF481 domain-containing protein [Rhodospirillales bacterium]|nr:DUF481 domain-containing protein [Rhodospirillales bacterium]